MNATAERAIYHSGRTHAEHSAWLDSLVGDDYRTVYMPIGYLFNLAEISWQKHALQDIDLPAAERLKLLDSIAACAFGPVGAQAIAAIEPMCGKGRQVFWEILSLPIEKQTRAFQAGHVFQILARLNPSLLKALRLCDRGDVPGKPRNRVLEDC
jgi:hypothetical protein